MSRNFVGRGSGYMHGDISRKMGKPGGRAMHDQWRSTWYLIMEYLKLPENADIQKSICVGCGTAKLTDKNGKTYFINARLMNLDSVKNIVTEIKKVNQPNQ